MPLQRNSATVSPCGAIQKMEEQKPGRTTQRRHVAPNGIGNDKPGCRAQRPAGVLETGRDILTTKPVPRLPARGDGMSHLHDVPAPKPWQSPQPLEAQKKCRRIKPRPLLLVRRLPQSVLPRRRKKAGIDRVSGNREAVWKRGKRAGRQSAPTTACLPRNAARATASFHEALPLSSLCRQGHAPHT